MAIQPVVIYSYIKCLTCICIYIFLLVIVLLLIQAIKDVLLSIDRAIDKIHVDATIAGGRYTQEQSASLKLEIHVEGGREGGERERREK